MARCRRPLEGHGARPQRAAQGAADLARLVTEVLAPAPVVAALLLAVAWRSAPTPAAALPWALLAAAFCSALPMLFILRGVRRGRLTDHHVRVRRQRRAPLLVAGGSVLVGLGLLLAAGAPRDVVALVGAGGVGLAVALAITLVWKISIHTAVAAGAVVVLALVFGPALLVLTPLVALSGWARVEVGDHTPAQVVAGAAVGAAVAGAAFPLLR
jgi:membrane-associated phospholipid phosphatase